MISGINMSQTHSTDDSAIDRNELDQPSLSHLESRSVSQNQTQTYKKLKQKYAQLQQNYNELKQLNNSLITQRDQLQTSLDTIQPQLSQLQEDQAKLISKNIENFVSSENSLLELNADRKKLLDENKELRTRNLEQQDVINKLVDVGNFGQGDPIDLADHVDSDTISISSGVSSTFWSGSWTSGDVARDASIIDGSLAKENKRLKNSVACLRKEKEMAEYSYQMLVREVVKIKTENS